MQQDSEIEPDVVTFTIILSACSHCGLVEEACSIWAVGRSFSCPGTDEADRGD
ncbi:Pentatricopeptide repeat protein 1 [Zostera marina]|uniref:Pentatricopeptide repeat protein 1 n=1 Tax=Zostera marina TaxID=29655 RepID=A0A0K9P911_ZOSMR|nr:Pentatricopeptide repeat protein 1 [Zostera marina]